MPTPPRRTAFVPIAILLLSAPGICRSETRLVCGAEETQWAWVQRIEIDPERKQALLGVAWSLPVSPSNMGQLDATIEDMSEMQDGVPIYAFNAYPQGPTELTNMFKLFRIAGKWRLIGAAFANRSGKLTLRAIDSGRAYECHEKW